MKHNKTAVLLSLLSSTTLWGTIAPQMCQAIEGDKKIVEKVLLSSPAGDSDFFRLLKVTERRSSPENGSALSAQIDAEIGARVVKTLPSPPTVGLDLVSPDGKVLYSKAIKISDNNWRKNYSDAHVIFPIDIPNPPNNSMVRLFNSEDQNKRIYWDASMYLDNSEWTAADSRFSGAISKFVKYEKFFERHKKWPIDLSNVEILQQHRKTRSAAEEIAAISNPNAEPSFTLEPATADVGQSLKSFYVVPVYEWQNCYSHVGMSDKVGEIKLPGGPRMQWMLRPGGLAAVVYPDGGIVYLARELTTLRKH